MFSNINIILFHFIQTCILIVYHIDKVSLRFCSLNGQSTFMYIEQYGDNTEIITVDNFRGQLKS